MKKLLKTIAVMMAFVLVVDTPVSASGLVVTGSGTAAFADAERQKNVYGTGDGQEGTGDGGQEGTGDGDEKGTGDGEDAQVVAVAVEGSKTLNVVAGETGVINVNVVTNKEMEYSVDWSVEGDAVIITEENGKSCEFTAIEGGKAVVTATAGNKSDSVVINVKEYVTDMYFEDDGEYIVDGKCNTYVKHKIDFAELLVKDPETATDEIYWSIDNTKVAKVDAKGVVTAKKAGEAVLTAATERGVFARLPIHVANEDNPIKKLSISKVETDGTKTPVKTCVLENLNDTMNLVAVCELKNPEADTTDNIEWTSANSKIVAVEDNGDGSASIEAVGVGKCKVTVKATSGKKAVLTVTANAKLKTLDVIDVETESDEAETAPAKKLTLKAIRDPEESKDKITWKTSDKKLATVSAKKNDTALVTIKAKTVAPNETKTVTITAQNKAGDVADSFTITINPSEITGLTGIEGKKDLLVGEEASYSVGMEGNGSEEEITWTSSNAKVLTVNAEGEAVALKAGKATIKATATLANGKTKSVSYKVTVKQPTTALSMKKPLVTMVEGKKKTIAFTAVKAPKGAFGDIKYEILSSDTEGVTITKNKVSVPATAKAGDVIVVQASVGDITAVGEIRVIKSKAKVSFENANITKNKLNLVQGDVVSLGAKVTPDINEELTFTVNKKGIVSVTEDGTVYALQPGTVKVTAKSTSGAKATVTIKVTVPQKDESTTDGNK